MAILVVGGNKASAKSTITQHLAYFLSLEKENKIAVYDADVQGSFKNWAKRRKDNNLETNFVFFSGKGNVAEDLLELEKKYDLIIVDVKGANSKEFISASAVSDLIIVPVEPTIKLLETLDELVVQQEMIEKDIFLFAVKTPSNVFSKKERGVFFQEWLKKYPTLKSLNADITSRSIFYKVDEMGATIFEFKVSSNLRRSLIAEKEIESLAKEIIYEINK